MGLSSAGSDGSLLHIEIGYWNHNAEAICLSAVVGNSGDDAIDVT